MDGDGNAFKYHSHLPFEMGMRRMQGPQKDFGSSSKQVKVSTEREK